MKSEVLKKLFGVLVLSESFFMGAYFFGGVVTGILSYGREPLPPYTNEVILFIPFVLSVVFCGCFGMTILEKKWHLLLLVTVNLFINVLTAIPFWRPI